MSIGWSDIRPEWLAVFASLTLGGQVEWMDDHRKYFDPVGQAVVFLNVTRVSSVGVDQITSELDEEASAPEDITFTVSGPRIVTLEVRVESMNHADNKFAGNLAEKIRTGLKFPSVKERLLSVETSIVRIGDYTDIPNIIDDDRQTSVAVFEVFFNVTASDEDPVKTTYIAQAEPQGTYL